MSFLQDNQYGFYDDDQIFTPKPIEIKQGDFGPWVQPALTGELKKNIKKSETNSAREVNTADYLSTLQSKGQKGCHFSLKIRKQKSENIK